MEFVNIEATPRHIRGKGPNARLRREGKIPAVAYGKGQPSRSLSVSPKDLVQALKGPWGRNAVLHVRVGEGEPFPALVADFTCHPVTRDLLHVDFLQIDLDKPVDVDVPLVCTGKPVGVVEGGTLRQIFRKLPLRCLPAAIPTEIVHDVTSMAVNDVAKVSDIPLPAGIEVRLPPEQTVIAVDAAVVEVEAEAAAAAEPGAEAAAAAPAAGAADEKDKDKDKK
jgi:large subunit ribosomal protein L25